MGLVESIPTEDALTQTEVILLFVGAIVPVCAALYAILTLLTPSPSPSLPSELNYRSPASREPAALPPSLTASHPFVPPTIALSIVIPAYNEAARLPAMLAELRAFFDAPGRTRADAFGAVAEGEGTQGWEVLVVDDGSVDETAEIALGVGKAWDADKWAGSDQVGRGELRVIKLEFNRGKGGAVKHGVLHSRGARVLFADADGASKFCSLALLHRGLDEIELDFPPAASSFVDSGGASSSAVERPAAKALSRKGKSTASREGNQGVDGQQEGGKLGVAIGSRAHLVSTDLVVKRSFLRNLLMRGFHLFVRTIGVRDIRDTQCGFKLFTRPAAALLFSDMHLDRWSFDVELLVLANLCIAYSPSPRTTVSFPLPISEVPIEWHEVAGSKISLAWDSLGMARDLVVLRACLAIGMWGRPVLALGEGRGLTKGQAVRAKAKAKAA